MQMDAMGPEAQDDYIAEEEGGVSVRPAGVAEMLHPVSTHLHPGRTAPPTPLQAAVASPEAPTVVSASVSASVSEPHASRGGTSVALLARTEAINASKAKGYTGNACSECGQLTMVRNGACEKCDSCGSTSGCS
jgi:ribonucleoside-diphosphate reductase alpha chain